jgi:ribonucleoside-triphosphate reductase
MKDQKVPNQPCVMKPDQTTVFSFPIKSPANAIVTEDMSAIDQLEMWLMYQRHWCEHKPSVTINVRKDEWFEVGAFVYKHFDEMSGVSFLPYNEHTYQQAPYQDITKREYETLLSLMPEKIDWSLLTEYEKEDSTNSSQTFACTGDVCEVVDIGA